VSKVVIVEGRFSSIKMIDFLEKANRIGRLR
jgi:hypothetical protein